ncbi:MAG: ferric reductase-like transmembrane domain-containing protein [Maritimibacter sp.]|nr:ferric reductase-like transmembrane domain-containing protein [Maritimibacter sp.]
MSANRLEAGRVMPWMDARGRLSPFKAASFAALCAPAVWMAVRFSSGTWDFISPYIPLIYHSGLWTTYLLLLSLLVTPLRRITGWGPLLQIRRMIGVAAFLYGVLHLIAWFGLRAWSAQTLTAEALSRPTIWVATLGFVVLFALTATSTDGAVRRMGPERWRRLHRLVYPAAFLGVLHFLMSPGSLQGKPFLMAGALVWLLGWRVLDRRGAGRAPRALFALGLAASAVTFFLQPVWLATFQALRQIQSPGAAMADNFDPQVWIYLGVPPVWILLGATLAVALYAAFRRRPARTA